MKTIVNKPSLISAAYSVRDYYVSLNDACLQIFGKHLMLHHPYYKKDFESLEKRKEIHTGFYLSHGEGISDKSMLEIGYVNGTQSSDMTGTLFPRIILKVILIFAGLFISLSFSTLAQPDFEKTIYCEGYSPNDSLMFIQQSLHLEPASYCQFPLLCQIGSSGEKYPDLLEDVKLTLSYYPELQGTKIKVYYSSIKQTMNSRPCFRNLFVKKGKRTYRIIINNNTGKEKGLPISVLSDDVRIGFIAHEVAHMLMYHQMNNTQTLKFVFKYVFSKKFVYNVERYTDNVAIEHHLARQLYAGTAYCQSCTVLTPEYRVYSSTYGLRPCEIICLWHKTASLDSVPDDSNFLISSMPDK
jgi:hypothetical protein